MGNWGHQCRKITGFWAEHGMLVLHVLDLHFCCLGSLSPSWTHKILDSVGLEESSKVINSRLCSSCHQVPPLLGFWTLPGMVTPPLLWGAHPKVSPLLQWIIFPDIQPEPEPAQLEALAIGISWWSRKPQILLRLGARVSPAHTHYF